MKFGAKPIAVWGSESAAAAYRAKLAKRYVTDAAIELIGYAGLTATPNDISLEDLRRAVDESGLGMFRRVWFLGDEDVERVAGDAVAAMSTELK